jgi:hypothetical protein
MNSHSLNHSFGSQDSDLLPGLERLIAAGIANRDLGFSNVVQTRQIP